MKFEKKELSEALKAKLTKNGKSLSMSEQTFSKRVERLYARLEKRASEDELDAVVEEYLPDFEDLEGNIRHDRSVFIKEWEKTHPQQTPPKDKPETQPGDEGVLATLQKQIAELVAQQKANETARKVADKRKAIIEKMRSEKVDDESWIESQMELLSVGEETDAEAVGGKLVSLFNKYHAGEGPSHTPGTPGGNGDEKVDFSDIVAIRSKGAAGSVSHQP